MKTITLNIDDDVICSLEKMVLLKTMTGNGNDVLVAAMVKTLQSIRDGKSEVELKFKKRID
jgi:hypothetical protein